MVSAQSVPPTEAEMPAEERQREARGCRFGVTTTESRQTDRIDGGARRTERYFDANFLI